jgi:hypothetical protein
MCLAFRKTKDYDFNYSESEDGKNLNLDRKQFKVDIPVQNTFILLRFPPSNNPTLSSD